MSGMFRMAADAAEVTVRISSAAPAGTAAPGRGLARLPAPASGWAKIVP